MLFCRVLIWAAMASLLWLFGHEPSSRLLRFWHTGWEATEDAYVSSERSNKLQGVDERKPKDGEGVKKIHYSVFAHRSGVFKWKYSYQKAAGQCAQPPNFN
jgi:hypothetical protein